MTKQTETKLLEDVTWIKAKLKNGLIKKIDQLDTWARGHPQVCPFVLKRRDVLKVRALEVAVVAVVLTIAQIILRALGVI